MIIIDPLVETIDITHCCTLQELYIETTHRFDMPEFISYTFPLVMHTDEHATSYYTLTKQAETNLYRGGLRIVTRGTNKAHTNYCSIRTSDNSWNNLVNIADLPPIITESMRHTLGYNEIGPYSYFMPTLPVSYDIITNKDKYMQTNPEWFI